MTLSVCIIPLTLGYEAIVDPDDYAELSQHLWSAKVTQRTDGSLPHVHAVRTINTDDGRRQLYMHREIMKAAPDQMVDHSNHHGLDNRRSNLRFCSHSGNNANADRRSRTKRRGVVQRDGRFYAVIQKDGRRITSPRCRSEEDAARTYDRMALEMHGEFAVLNYPRHEYLRSSPSPSVA